MKPYKLVSLLLQYPDEELLAARADVAEAVGTLSSRAARDSIRRFLIYAETASAAELQRDYVATFDFDRHASLHLTFHTHGDRRQRGIELLRLKRSYAEAGFPLGGEELPDYLPVLLEFADLAPEGVGEEVLSGLREPIEHVRSNLRRRGSPYGHLLDAVCAVLPKLTKRQAETVRKLAADEPPTELVGLEPFGAPESGFAPVPGGIVP